ncbi:hypothetical protein J6590_063879 [Homalodisca vitripennis]|nr:hypothetical protein J6590_063879 [Homalodisca vitripennis]
MVETIRILTDGKYFYIAACEIRFDVHGSSCLCIANEEYGEFYALPLRNGRYIAHPGQKKDPNVANRIAMVRITRP